MTGGIIELHRTFFFGLYFLSHMSSPVVLDLIVSSTGQPSSNPCPSAREYN